MLFTLVVSFFLVNFTKISGCPTDYPCITANKRNGSCVPSGECMYINELKSRSQSARERNYLERSVCGRGKDGLEWYCCDNSALKRRPAKPAVNVEAAFSPIRPDVEVEQGIYHPSTPATTTASFSPNRPDVEEVHYSYYPSTPATTTTIKIPEIIPCQTPNGEKAQCISIYQCQKFVSKIVNTTRTVSQDRFLKESKCGVDDNKKPLICCGSDTNFSADYGIENKTLFRPNRLILKEYCGTQITLPDRIFGGKKSDLSEFPWLVLLNYETHNGETTFACSGSLITSRYVLTAAHCVSARSVGTFANKLIGVRLGEWDYSNKGRDCVIFEGQKECNEEEVNVGIDRVKVHPTYQDQANEQYNDIALIRLDRQVNFTNYIRPICLPDIDDYITPGEYLTVAGWGIVSYSERTTIKQKVKVPAVPSSQCSVMFEREPRLSQVGWGQFCAGGEPDKDACVGDSGGPLMRQTNSSEQWFVEGIVSFGNGCGVTDEYGVYTKVSEYLGWIHRTIEP